jgi:hypothetical protein
MKSLDTNYIFTPTSIETLTFKLPIIPGKRYLSGTLSWPAVFPHLEPSEYPLVLTISKKEEDKITQDVYLFDSEGTCLKHFERNKERTENSNPLEKLTEFKDILKKINTPNLPEYMQSLLRSLSKQQA